MSDAGNGDDLQSCVVTDMRALSSTHELCVELDGPACGTATVSGGDPHANRIVTMKSPGFMMDPREVDIGDRIRIITAGGPAATTAAAVFLAGIHHAPTIVISAPTDRIAKQ